MGVAGVGERGFIEMRRAARVDANQARIVQALRKAGVAVTPLHMVGRGVADLLCSYRKLWFVMEVKDGDKPPSARKLTKDEAEWIGEQKAPVYIVTSPQEALGFLRYS